MMEKRNKSVDKYQADPPDSQIYRVGGKVDGQREDTGEKQRLCHCHYALPARRHGHMKFVCAVYASSIPRYALCLLCSLSLWRKTPQSNNLYGRFLYPFHVTF